MRYQGSISAVALVAALSATLSVALAADYPDWSGQWVRVGVPNFGKAPLTPEYQKVFDAVKADLAAGGVGGVPSTFCVPQGMPMMMNLYDPMELIITPKITYLLISHVNDSYRRIYTDGRDFPKDAEATYAGYSIGKWVDTKGDGHYDELDVETRDFRGPRVFDATGLPLHEDNETVISERFFLDKSDPNTINDEITIRDHALTQPYTIVKKAARKPNVRPVWHTDACSADNLWVKIGDEPYYLSADGKLMPTKKDEPPPDLTYFKQKPK